MPADPRFIAIIDAGSTSSRLLLYKYDHDIIANHRNTKPLKFEMVCDKKTQLPMDVDANVGAMTTHLTPLVDGCLATRDFPTGERTVPLYIMATAGMRDADGTTPVASTNAMQRAWNAIQGLRQGGLERRKVYDIGIAADIPADGPNAHRDRHSLVVTPQNEGVYAWIALNQGLDRSDSWVPGILELGGKSMQVAYAAAAAGADIQAVCLWDSRHFVWSKSWLLGAEVSRIAAVEEKLRSRASVYNPCLPYPQRSKLGATETKATGNGNFPECLRMARSYLSDLRPLTTVPSLDIQLAANRFYSLSTFWHTYQFFSQFGAYDINSAYDPQLFRRAVDKYCTRSEWFPFGQEGLAEHMHKHCFAAAWMMTLFHDPKGFQLQRSDQAVWKDLIHFPMTKALQDRSSWTIGAAVMAVRHDGDVKRFCPAGEDNGQYPPAPAPAPPAPSPSPDVVLSVPSSPIHSTPVVVIAPASSLFVESAQPVRAPSIPTAIAGSLPFGELNQGSTFSVGLVSGVLLVTLILIGYRRFTRRAVQLPVSDAKHAVEVDEVVRTRLTLFDKGKGTIFLAGADTLSFV